MKFKDNVVDNYARNDNNFKYRSGNVKKKNTVHKSGKEDDDEYDGYIWIRAFILSGKQKGKWLATPNTCGIFRRDGAERETLIL